MYLKEEYSKLNESYSKKLVFRLGDSAGFFSEYNIMIFSILYCLNNKIGFKLYSKNANFSSIGWNDYFLPFCDEVNDAFQVYFNYRPKNEKGWLRELISNREFWRLKYFFYQISFSGLHKRFSGFNYYTQDIWPHLFDPRLKDVKYYIPELNIEGGLLNACNRLVELTWHFNPETESELENIIKAINLPSQYISCQIRGGDKIKEYDLLSVEEYIKELNRLTIVKDIFVLTDDYRLIDKFRRLCPDRNWYTLCNESERGYDNNVFIKQTDEYKREKLLRLLSSIELLKRSELFVGTKTTNPGVFMNMAVPNKCYFIDANDHPLYGYFSK